MKYILLTLSLLTLSLAPTYAHCGHCGTDDSSHCSDSNKSTDKDGKTKKTDGTEKTDAAK